MSGVGLLEVYDLDATAASRLANISGRASVETGGNLLFAGFIVGNNIGAARVVVRALGPSLIHWESLIRCPIQPSNCMITTARC